jgi:hypothetical protein
MAPFGERAGGGWSVRGAAPSAFGGLASAAVGWIGGSGAVPMASIIAICAAIALASYLLLVRAR